METHWDDIQIPASWRQLGKAAWKDSDGRLYEAAKDVFVRVYFDTVTERWGATMRNNRQRYAKYTALFWNKKLEAMNELLNNEISRLTDLTDEKEKD